MTIPRLEMQLEISGPEGSRRFKNATTGLLQFASDIDQAVSFRELNPILMRILNSFLKAVADAMEQRHSTPWQPRTKLPEGPKHGKLAKRSGDAMSKVRDSIIVKNQRGLGVEGNIGGPFYLITHEEGRTIRGKNTRKGYMAIPLEDALDGRGIPKRPGPRSYENTFVRPLKSGEGFVILQRSAGRILALYALKKTVNIPERLGMGETIKMGSNAMVEKMFNALTIHIATKAVTGRNVNPAGFF
jgi:hypothetical protein